MFARQVHKVFFWIGVVAALAIPFIPAFTPQLSSAHNVKTMADGMAGFFVTVIICALLAITSFVGSVVAGIAAHFVREPFTAKPNAGVPVVLALVALVLTYLLFNAGVYSA